MLAFTRRRRLDRSTTPPPRRALLDRHDDLAHRAQAVDEQQRLLAEERLELRAELSRLRDRLWPAGPGHAFKNWRRPRIGGPPPIPPPLANAVPLYGRRLRYAVLGVLLDAPGPMSLPDIHRALHLRGYRLSGNHVVKQLADALGYEHDHGRACRVARGMYRLGELSPARRRRAEAERGSSR
jgi:hypothetical protein